MLIYVYFNKNYRFFPSNSNHPNSKTTVRVDFAIIHAANACFIKTQSIVMYIVTYNIIYMVP